MGMRMLELGALAAHHNRLRRAALPRLHALHESTGHLVHLYVLDGTEVVRLERIGGAEDSAVPSRGDLFGPGRTPAPPAAAAPQPRTRVSEGEMDAMMGWLRFSEWM
ncbi:hypothetical protein ACGFYP_25230 [Streptomyces sp. NPDC048370]|uniref:hypothetical protein n=1 Tax=Streptomyces sp. NPDC048370 TaxID=3365540 RepID=UPI003717AE9C